MSCLLRLGFWNINGYNSSILGNKLGTDDFMDIINKHDIFAIVETHAKYDFLMVIMASGIARGRDRTTTTTTTSHNN